MTALNRSRIRDPKKKINFRTNSRINRTVSSWNRHILQASVWLAPIGCRAWEQSVRVVFIRFKICALSATWLFRNICIVLHIVSPVFLHVHGMSLRNLKKKCVPVYCRNYTFIRFLSGRCKISWDLNTIFSFIVEMVVPCWRNWNKRKKLKYLVTAIESEHQLIFPFVIKAVLLL